MPSYCDICRTQQLHAALTPPLATNRPLGYWQLCDVLRGKDSCCFCQFLHRISEFTNHPSSSDDELQKTIYLEAASGETEPGCRILVRGAVIAGLLVVDPQREYLRTLPLGAMIRLIAPLSGRGIGDTVDWSLLRNWLGHCCSSHDTIDHLDTPLPSSSKKTSGLRPWVSHSSPRNAIQDPKFRLVDVEKKCVVHASMKSSYTCLSYVWGDSNPVRLSNQNYSAFTRQGGLDDGACIPKTFRDAIHIARQLDINFIWIDALCIQHDDEHDLSHQISNMDLIYRNAMLTIVSATPSADHDIPGVRPGSRASTSVAYRQGPIQLVYARPTLAEAIKFSDWEKRGWTLQEKFFSKRLLLFTEYQVYYKCSEVIWTEDTIAEPADFNASDKSTRQTMNTITLPVPTIGWINDDRTEEDLAWKQFSQYQDLLKEYVSRCLTRDSDILAAFSGILNSLNPCLGFHLYGLPERIFDIALLWHFSSHRTITRRRQFPSWSWCGWHGEPNMELDWLVAAEDQLDFFWRRSDEGKGIQVLNSGPKGIPSLSRYFSRPRGSSELEVVVAGAEHPSHILSFRAETIRLWIGQSLEGDLGIPYSKLYLSLEALELERAKHKTSDHITQLAEEGIGKIHLAKQWREHLPDNYQGEFVHMSSSRVNDTWYKRRHGTYALPPAPDARDPYWKPKSWNLMLIETNFEGLSERVQVCNVALRHQGQLERFQQEAAWRLITLR